MSFNYLFFRKGVILFIQLIYQLLRCLVPIYPLAHLYIVYAFIHSFLNLFKFLHFYIDPSTFRPMSVAHSAIGFILFPTLALSILLPLLSLCPQSTGAYTYILHKSKQIPVIN